MRTFFILVLPLYLTAWSTSSAVTTTYGPGSNLSSYTAHNSDIVYLQNATLVSANIDARDTSSIYFQSGSARALWSNINGTAYLTGGSIGVDTASYGTSHLFVSGGQANLAGVYGSSTFTMQGGSIVGYTQVYQSGTFNVTGGNVAGLISMQDNALMNLLGGTITNSILMDEATNINVYGLSFGPLAAGTYRLADFNGPSDDFYYRGLRVPVTWSDGQTQTLRLNGNRSDSLLKWTGTVTLQIVPEPASLGLVGFGAVLLLGRRSFRRRRAFAAN